MCHIKEKKNPMHFYKSCAMQLVSMNAWTPQLSQSGWHCVVFSWRIFLLNDEGFAVWKWRAANVLQPHTSIILLCF